MAAATFAGDSGGRQGVCDLLLDVFFDLERDVSEVWTPPGRMCLSAKSTGQVVNIGHNRFTSHRTGRDPDI